MFFILRGRSRAKLSSLFRVRISRRSVTDCPSDLLAPIETMKRTRSKQVKQTVAKKKLKGLKSYLFRKKKKNTGVFSVGHPSKYLPRPTGLNFRDRTRTVAFHVVSESA